MWACSAPSPHGLFCVEFQGFGNDSGLGLCHPGRVQKNIINIGPKDRGNGNSSYQNHRRHCALAGLTNQTGQHFCKTFGVRMALRAPSPQRPFSSIPWGTVRVKPVDTDMSGRSPNCLLGFAVGFESRTQLWEIHSLWRAGQGFCIYDLGHKCVSWLSPGGDG